MKIYLISTDKYCFVSDCAVTDGYDWNYHHTRITDFYFDGNKAESTFSKNWFKIKQYPKEIKILKSLPDINKRYEINDKEMVSVKLPEIISYEDRDSYEEGILCLYSFKSEKQDPIFENVEYEIEVVLKVDKYEMPETINYAAIKKVGWDEKIVKITNENIHHQLFDKLIFPEVMLHLGCCFMSSYDLYSIIRQHIKENIDKSVAKITSNYDFCFTVKKIVTLMEPRKYTYNNIFARTKRQRSKIHHGVQEHKEIEIFEMTHTQENYRSYTPIQPLHARNESELKKKIDDLLKKLIEIINEPLNQCTHCSGTGYAKDIDEKIKINLIRGD